LFDLKVKKTEYVILVGVVTKDTTIEKVEEYLEELAFLAETAGGVTYRKYIQRLQIPDKRFFIGSGKLEEIKTDIIENGIETVIFDEELTPTQQRNLEKELECKIIDRTYLILDIFAQRAKTAQAKTQVELAQFEYLLPRLRGLWTHLERQRGGIGMRGPGEKEIETDRRIVKDKIAKLKKDLEVLEKQTQTRRKTRESMIRVSLVGYTNVGKSTIMNVLSKADVFAENKLFATLDTTVRKVVIDDIPFLLSDTVGFIRKLPHHLVESFKSTLDEARESDLILHVVDISHPLFREQIDIVNDTLKQMKAHDVPVMMVFNKIDLYQETHYDKYLPEEVKLQLTEELEISLRKEYNKPSVFISAQTLEGMNEFKNKLVLMVQDMYYKRYPYKAGY
jgi:GTPase